MTQTRHLKDGGVLSSGGKGSEMAPGRATGTERSIPCWDIDLGAVETGRKGLGVEGCRGPVQELDVTASRH